MLGPPSFLEPPMQLNTSTRALLFSALLASSPLALGAAQPPAASSIFRNPQAASMADALARGDSNAAMLGVARKVDPNISGLAGIRPIHYVVSYADDLSLASLRALIGAGADVNAKMDNGSTPLGLAAERATADALGILLGSRANPKLESHGRLPIQIAMAGGHRKSFELLAMAGSPLSGPSYATGSAAQDLARTGKNDWLLWMAQRGLVASGSLPQTFWSDICSSSDPSAAAVAKVLSTQPRALGCKR